MFGHLDAFKALVEAGAEPFPPQDGCGNTPMTVAARHRHPHITAFLCDLLQQAPRPITAPKLTHTQRNVILVGLNSPKRLLFDAQVCLIDDEAEEAG